MTSPSHSDRPTQQRRGAGRGGQRSGPAARTAPAAGRGAAPRTSSAFGVRSFVDGAPTAAVHQPAGRGQRPATTGPVTGSVTGSAATTDGRPAGGERRGPRDAAASPQAAGTSRPRRRRSGRGRGAAAATGAATPPSTTPTSTTRTAGSSTAAPATAAPAGQPAAATAPFSTAARSTTAAGAAGAALADVPSFAELGVPATLLEPLTRLGAVSPFPIQAATLPSTLAGRDVLGRGRTGSGKTIAFAVPLAARLAGRRSAPRRPRGLVLLPTRELALQVHRTLQPLAAAVGLRTTTVFGGVGFGPQVSALQAGVDIVVACPGRLEDLIARGDCDLGAVEITVLDEADHMADLGFLPGVRRLLRATPRNGQRLLFSATLDNGISVLVDDFLTDAVTHAVDEDTSPVETMTHHVFAIDKDDRTQVIRELAAGGGRRMLFTRTKYGAKKWAAALSKYGIPAVDLHGNLAQNARERNLAAFASGAAKVLVATDIAARGIHVDDVELVVHLDPPAEHKAYLHRSGRTARAGAGGTVVTLMLPEQADDVRTLMKRAGITARPVPVRPGDAALSRLAG
ncbi:DEAD/DEAH box helicase [Nakamurella endophytica]|uniref:Superfamily II DNA/RNA helicase n=1 Tax=Nakamurella endophytica TaxID=1748367 RepID=A0A917SZB4_9ACTN|nr:DEAD/DEAH box helicase [Nakamurella endophytica]GGM04743.1 hypothetical protein GCM10011594_26240 [Nakamurella endophytica]